MAVLPLRLRLRFIPSGLMASVTNAKGPPPLWKPRKGQLCFACFPFDPFGERGATALRLSLESL